MTLTNRASGADTTPMAATASNWITTTTLSTLEHHLCPGHVLPSTANTRHKKVSFWKAFCIFHCQPQKDLWDGWVVGCNLIDYITTQPRPCEPSDSRNLCFKPNLMNYFSNIVLNGNRDGVRTGSLGSCEPVDFKNLFQGTFKIGDKPWFLKRSEPVDWNS